MFYWQRACLHTEAEKQVLVLIKQMLPLNSEKFLLNHGKAMVVFGSGLINLNPLDALLFVYQPETAK